MLDNQYVNLARKYRPQIIKDLIGQDFLVKTLQNAFTLNKVSHSFMLTGVRGVGKTTTARIIAKALNCIGVDGMGGMTLNPCGVCDNCIAIVNDRHMDVIEMDAASKTGIDDVREIIDNSRYKPVSARYKVFIIDEIHMLSKNAFNALLKTLEEPPQHLKFIFATTEIKKVPITVLSRCQKFYLNRVPTLVLKDHLQNICIKENITFDEESLFLLAKGGNGSVRDSLSLLDQAIVFCDNNLQISKIHNMVGNGSTEDIYNLFLSLINNNVNDVFSIAYKQYNNGLDGQLLIEELLNICHNCLCIHMLKQNIISTILELSDFEYNKSLEINSKASSELLVLIWQVLSRGLLDLKDSSNYLQHLNLVFFKILHLHNIFDVDKLMNEMDENISLQHSIPHSHINQNTQQISKVNNSIDEINNKVSDVFPNAKFIKEE